MKPSVLAFPSLLSVVALTIAACSGASSSGVDIDDTAPDGAVGGSAITKDGSVASGDAAKNDGGSRADASKDAHADATADATPDGSTACNALDADGPIVDAIGVAADPPAPTGGAVTDGTYVLREIQLYGGPGGPTGKLGSGRAKIFIKGAVVQVVTESMGNTLRSTATLAVSGPNFTATPTCPLGGTPTSGTYSVSLFGGKPAFTRYDVGGGATAAQTYVKE